MSLFNVATLNISGWRMSGQNSWFERRINALNFISQYSPDIIGFQELHLSNMLYLTERIEDLTFWTGIDEGNGMIPNTIAVNEHRFFCVSRDSVWLSNTPYVKSIGWNSQNLRACSIYHLWDLQDQRLLIVVNVHLDHVSEEARVNGSKMILGELSDIDTGVPIVITGDFNCDTYAPFEGVKYTGIPNELFSYAGFRDAWHARNNQYPPPNTFNGFEGSEYEGGDHGTWRVDWILAKNLDVVSCEVVTQPDDQLISDHYPVVAMLDYQD